MEIEVLDRIVAFIIVVGSLFMALAAVGILKLPDFFLRMAAIAKASTLGFLLFLLAGALGSQDALVALKLLIVGFFVFITAPTASHLIARAAYRHKADFFKNTVIQDSSDKK